jgi:hypothetical protein
MEPVMSAREIQNGLKPFAFKVKWKKLCNQNRQNICEMFCFATYFNPKIRLFHFYIVMFYNFNIFAP